MSAVTVVQSMKSSAKDSIKGPSMELPQPQHPLSIRAYAYSHNYMTHFEGMSAQKNFTHMFFCVQMMVEVMGFLTQENTPGEKHTTPSKF